MIKRINKWLNSLEPVTTDFRVNNYNESVDPFWTGQVTGFPTINFIKECWTDLMISTEEYNYQSENDSIKLAVKERERIAAAEYVDPLREARKL